MSVHRAWRWLQVREGFVERSWLEVVKAGERSCAREIFARADQLRHLADVAEIVQRPFVQHLRKRDRAYLFVYGRARAVFESQAAEEFDVGLALFFEMVEGIFG